MIIKLDRCGVYLCLEGLLTYPAIKVVLFIAEEVGMIGSSAVDIDWFKDCAFIFQSDRKGDSDLIYYSNGVDMMDQDFKDFIKPELDNYGYTFVSGLATDVGALVKRKVGCVCFNISSGYFDAHSLSKPLKKTFFVSLLVLVFLAPLVVYFLLSQSTHESKGYEACKKLSVKHPNAFRGPLPLKDEPRYSLGSYQDFIKANGQPDSEYVYKVGRTSIESYNYIYNKSLFCTLLVEEGIIISASTTVEIH